MIGLNSNVPLTLLDLSHLFSILTHSRCTVINFNLVLCMCNPFLNQELCGSPTWNSVSCFMHRSLLSGALSHKFWSLPCCHVLCLASGSLCCDWKIVPRHRQRAIVVSQMSFLSFRDHRIALIVVHCLKRIVVFL